MANNVLADKLAARIVEIEAQVKDGKLDLHIALTTIVEETIAEAIDVINGIEANRNELAVIQDAISLITIKD